MSQAEEFVERFLAHYASEYYDPVKAREYYLRTRELKGRQSSSDLTVKGNKGRSEQRKQAWDYAKNQISEREKSDQTSLSESRKQAVEAARAVAEGRRNEISFQLKALFASLIEKSGKGNQDIEVQKQTALDKLTEQTQAKLTDLKDKAFKEIDSLPKIPQGISDERRARLVAQRDQKIAQIRGTLVSGMQSVLTDTAKEREAISAASQNDREALTAYIKTERTTGSATAQVNREQVRADLQATVEKARADYEVRREGLKAEYEAKRQSEFDAIKKLV